MLYLIIAKDEYINQNKKREVNKKMKNKKYHYGLKDKILITINYIVGFLLLFFMCAIDSNSIIPYIGILICGSWLVCMGIANGVIQL